MALVLANSILVVQKVFTLSSEIKTDVIGKNSCQGSLLIIIMFLFVA